MTLSLAMAMFVGREIGQAKHNHLMEGRITENQYLQQYKQNKFILGQGHNIYRVDTNLKSVLQNSLSQIAC